MPSIPEDKQQFETRLAQLSRTQKQVLEQFVQGHDDEVIAQSLEIVENTVRQHISRIANKLGIDSDSSDKGFRRREIVRLFRTLAPERVASLHYCDEPLPVPTRTLTTPEPSIAIELEAVDQLGRNDHNFVGRLEAIATLDGFRERGSKLVQIVAAGGQGKTTLARKYLQNRFAQVIEFAIAKETKDVASVESLLEEKLRQLGEEPGREFMVSLDRLKQKLQNQPIGVLIDNVEPALSLDGSGQFLPEHRRYVELLRVLSDCSLQSFTLITSRERLNEGLDITLYSLPSLTVSAWDEFWRYQRINTDINLFTEIHKIYGGNALAMKVLCNPIINDYQGDTAAYWHDNKTEDNLIVETVVANLIKEQFERLKTINLDAYNLLCRLGCYRYQDVLTVPETGLIFLLWDVAENQHKRTIKILKERHLIEFSNGDHWLHSVIRKEAIERLKNSHDWEKANLEAANFWTNKVQHIKKIPEDIFYAFESFHHYIAIHDYDKAANVILHERPNSITNNLAEWEIGEPLGRTFYKYGLSSHLINYGESILNNIKNQLVQVKLYNLIGSCFWSIGDIKKAILIYKTAIALIDQRILITQSKQISEAKIIKLGCLKQIGICLLDLYEIEEAIKYIKDVVGMSQEYAPVYQKIMKPAVYLIIAYDRVDFSRHSLKNSLIAKMVESQYPRTKLTTGFKEYGLLFAARAFLNVGNYQKSNRLYTQLIKISTQYNLKPIQGKALTGLAEIYRIQNDIKAALAYHKESIEMLEKIGAKCDLAEAYFQLALTYQQIGEKANAQEYFDKAIYLWSPQQIDAPKQIERVLKAING